MTNYKLLCAQMEALTEGIPHQVANLANASALLWQTLPDINWAGVYKMENGILVLGPFQGKPACIEIGVGKGVCGTAVAEDRTQLVYDVHQFPGHIACDSASNSEIVVPIHVNGKIWGVLGREQEYIIPWRSVCRIGFDIILVDVDIKCVTSKCDCPI